MTKLSRKRQAFIDEYTKDFNGKQAAIRAGYAPRNAKSTASKLLKNPTISNLINIKMGLFAMDAEEALRLLGKMAREGRSETARLRALENIIKVHGLTKDRVAIDGHLKLEVTYTDDWRNTKDSAS